MTKNELPPHLKSAKFGNDVERLRAAGRKGARTRKEKLKIKKEEEADLALIQKAIEAEELQLGEWERKVQANEHILDADGNTLDYEEPIDPEEAIKQ